MAALLTALAICGTARADPIRIAYFQTELGRDGPGLLLRDLIREIDPQVQAALDIIVLVEPDILVLGGIDFDHELRSLSELRNGLAARGLDLTHVFSEEPNSGAAIKPPFVDAGPADASLQTQSFGKFRGSRGMAILSALPFAAEPQSFTDLIWDGLPWADPPLDADHRDAQRLSSHNHWLAPIALPNGRTLSLLTLHASAPVFDGPEDLNGHRNADEIQLWAEVLKGWRPKGSQVTGIPFPVVVGTLNADPRDGESRSGAVDALLRHPALQDPEPSSAGGSQASSDDGGVNARHRSNPALDTVDWPEDRPNSPGNLRVDYILPARALQVVSSGVLWPGEDQPELQAKVRQASRHRLVWVDLYLP